MSTRNRPRTTTIVGLQWAATAFYVVAVVHGLWLHRRGGESDTRTWALIYLGGMVAAFVAGSGQRGDRTLSVCVTVLLIAFYAAIRAGIASRGPGDDQYFRGAAVEALALLLAYVLVYGRQIVPCADKMQELPEGDRSTSQVW